MSDKLLAGFLFTMFSLFGCASAQVSMQNAPKPEPALIIELQYQPAKEKVIPSFDRGLGRYLGSGSGCVSGRMNGTVELDLYEDQRDTRLHRAQFVGVIVTTDGSRLRFESIGFFVHRESDPNYWDMTAALFLEANQQQYPWLEVPLAIWAGAVDIRGYRHSYRVNLPQERLP